MHRNRAVMILGLLLGATTPALPQNPAGPPARLADLAWLAGHWTDESAGGLSEEVWTAPHGDSILGMWRRVREDKARVFELFAIMAEEEGLVLRLRHFDARFVGWEEKDKPLIWPLVRSGPREAVFEGRDIGEKGTARLIYRRPDDDTLVAVLEKEGRTQEFRYRRR